MSPYHFPKPNTPHDQASRRFWKESNSHASNKTETNPNTKKNMQPTYKPN